MIDSFLFRMGSSGTEQPTKWVMQYEAMIMGKPILKPGDIFEVLIDETSRHTLSIDG